jgi:hypothetical protein
VTLFTALIPVACVDEECSNVDCVSSVFRTATLRIDNYSYVDKYVLTRGMYSAYVTSERCSWIAGNSGEEGRDSDTFFVYWVNMKQQWQCNNNVTFRVTIVAVKGNEY